ncbi:MAG: F0F1 ATP synthase subunit epsilon [Candidatus Deferrimicrobiaceae bacterium]
MGSGIRLELVTPQRLLVSEEVDEVIAPGYEGEFGVLPEHTQYLAILSIGVLRYRKRDETNQVALGGGFAEVTPDRVVILADVAEKAEEIDVDRARQAHERAEAALKDLSLDDATYNKIYGALRKAIARMSAAS